MKNAVLKDWIRFWFTPSSPSLLLWTRRLLGLVAAVYFVSAMNDVDLWYSRGAPASSSNLATFFRTAELTGDARWMVSPLFMWDTIFGSSTLGESALVYRGYLVIGIVLAVLVSFSDRLVHVSMPDLIRPLVRENWIGILLWIWFIGWANRTVLLAGVVEPVLSVSLAALAISPVAVVGASGDAVSWRATLARRLLAVQATMIGLLTTATMLASPTWWNGTGAYALIAPAEDRLFSATDTAFEIPIIFEGSTFLLVALLPLGIVFAWRSTTRGLGVALVWVWCVMVGLLSANLLYAATIGIIAGTIGESENSRATAGASGADKLNGGNAELAP